ncbi:uncharacterized protein LOC130625656 [Hydractinia symbiolongicarpus]|uniref:uncharacterized protein LOC130625656 n=1 Tax=Hydractinia symbiolongicarpus TaxID=13093 RepID=UPI00254A3BE5|nr:uncharacterized protein LOC130625656 [Hydractinia symbiolongicarpus]
MNNVTMKAVGVKKVLVPAALSVNSPHKNIVKKKKYSINVMLSDINDSIPPIYLTLLKQTNRSLEYKCPKNYNASYANYKNKGKSTFQRNVYIMFCKHCPRSTYRLLTSSQKIQIVPGNIIKPFNKQTQCFSCPPGSNCDSHIKSNDRFWRFESQNHLKLTLAQKSTVVHKHVENVHLPKVTLVIELECSVEYVQQGTRSTILIIVVFLQIHVLKRFR